MKRFALTALALVLAGSGPAFAGSAADDATSAAEAANLEETQPQSGPGTDVGEQTEPTAEKEITVGSSGDTATINKEEETLTPESDVTAAEPENMMDKGDTATIN